MALRDGTPVGFVHAGFGPNDEGTALSTDIGTTYLLMLARMAPNDPRWPTNCSPAREAYLRERGAKVIYAGGIRPLNGFYLGLYGGSELAGRARHRSRARRHLPSQRLPRDRPRA